MLLATVVLYIWLWLVRRGGYDEVTCEVILWIVNALCLFYTLPSILVIAVALSRMRNAAMIILAVDLVALLLLAVLHPVEIALAWPYIAIILVDGLSFLATRPAVSR